MSRSGYNEDGESSAWSLICWRGQVASAIRGKRGQAFLHELLEALDAMPVKRLIAHDLIAKDGVCALGSIGVKRGLELEKLDPYDYDQLGEVFGIARQLVCEIEYINDDAHYYATPEQRWQHIRDWTVRSIAKEKDG